MHSLLTYPALMAYAESADPNATGLVIILGGVLIVVICAALAMLLILISRSRRHRHGEHIKAAAILWSLMAAASFFYAMQSQMNWSKEYNLRLSTGYFDPGDATGAPALPWRIWIMLAMAYTALLFWSKWRKPTPGG